MQRVEGLKERGRKLARGPRQDSTTSELYSETANKLFCIVECIRSLVAGERMNLRRSNAYQHGSDNCQFGPGEFTNRLHSQLLQDRELGFYIQYICEQTGLIVRAKLLSHGDTVIRKVAAIDQQPSSALRQRITEESMPYKESTFCCTLGTLRLGSITGIRVS